MKKLDKHKQTMIIVLKREIKKCKNTIKKNIKNIKFYKLQLKEIKKEIKNGNNVNK